MMSNRACSTHGQTIFARKLEEQRAHSSPGCRREDNIRMDLRKTGYGSVNWIHQAQEGDQWRELVNTVMNLRVP
jgi:hypothetical protein